MSITKILKKSPWLYNICFMLFIYGGRQIKFIFEFFLRKSGINLKYKYHKIKQFKNIHMGERCFIVGTGPSLCMEDLEKIKGEYSFSVNSIVLSYEDTDWRPTYYAIQDRYGYEKLSKAIIEANMPIVFNGISNKRMTPVMDIEYIPYPLNLLDHGKAIPNHITKFSKDAFKCVYAGHSITYSCMELAVYMGFKEIILLGIDCDYSSLKNHVKEYTVQDDLNASYLMHESYKVARVWADRNNVEILNATRNAKLDVFERVRLEDVIHSLKKTDE